MNGAIFALQAATMTEATPSATQPPGRNRAEKSLPHSFRDRFTEMFAKRELKRKQRRYGTHHLIAGTSAGLVTTAALYPLDLVKTRYQVTAVVQVETVIRALLCKT